MTEQRAQTPTIGRIVIYRSRAGVDMPAIITALGPRDDDGEQRLVHLHQFSPPGEATDQLDYQWGAPMHDGDGDPDTGTWRWPERAR